MKRHRAAAALLAAGMLTAPVALVAAAPATALPCQTCDDDGGGGGGGGGRRPAPVPALVERQVDSIGQGIHMDTVARVSRGVGLVSGEPTRTWSTWWGVGGHGTVAVLLLDAGGNVIGVTNPQTYGVDARSVFWARSDRRDHWSQTFDPVVTREVADVQILHTSASRDNFVRDLQLIRDRACTVWDVVRPGECPLGPVQ